MGLLDVPPYKAAQRCEFTFDPAGSADGAISLPGVQFTSYPSSTAPAPLSVVGGKIAHTPFSGASSAGYLQVWMSGPCRRIGAMLEWPTNATGACVLIFPVSPWSPGVVTGTAMHLTIYGNGIWELTRITTPGGVFTSTVIANWTRYGRFQTVWGTGMRPFEVYFDPEASACVLSWPDGTGTTVYSSFFSAEISNLAMWELFETNGASDVPGKIGRIWADTYDPDPVARAGPSLAAVRWKPTPPSSFSVSGTLAIDPTQTDTIYATLAGNLTSIYLTKSSGFAPRRLTLHLIQDATGGRTATGWAAPMSLAGGGIGLTATATKRDILTFDCDGMGRCFEVARAVNV